MSVKHPGGRADAGGEAADDETVIANFDSVARVVEVSLLADGGVAVRDREDPDRCALLFTKEEWEAFKAGARAGEFSFANCGSGVRQMDERDLAV